MFFAHRRLAGPLTAAFFVFPALARAGQTAAPNPPAPTPPVSTPPAAKPPAARPAAKPPVKLPAGVAARVNGKNITRGEVLTTLDAFGGQPLLRQMIETAVIEQEARRLDVWVTAEEIQKGVDETKKNLATQLMMQGTPMTFAEYAARDGVTEGLLRWSIRRQILARKAFGKTIEKNVPTLDGQVQASHILIATVPLNPSATAKPPTDEEAKKKIEEIRAEIESKKITFADAAKKYSDDKGSGAQGGSLGWFGKGMMDPTFQSAAFELSKPGDVSQPVKSQYGWHLIQLDKKGSAATAAEKAAWKQQQVDEQTANAQALRTWMADLVNKADITTNPSVRLSGASAPAAKPAAAKKGAAAPKTTSR